MFGQALSVSSSSGAPGDKVVLDISMDSQAGQAPAVLKWELMFPARLLEIDGSGPEPSKTAKESGKSLTCAVRAEYTFVCVLAGGEKPIANGPIATFRFKIQASAHTGTSIIKIDQVDAVTKDLKTLKLSGAEGRVEIQ